METENIAPRQRDKTVRIVTDFPVLVQAQATLKREGRNKPITVLLGPYLVKLSLTDSGEPIVKIAEPP